MQFRYLNITADRYADVIEHLWLNYYVDEPMSKSVGMTRSNVRETAILHATLAEGLSVMALDEDNQIAGVRLCGIARPGDWERALAEVADIRDDVTVRMLWLVCEANIQLDLFARLQCDRIFELRIGSVARRYRRLGLARDLLMLACRRALEVGVPYVKSESSGIYSQRVLLNNGFEEYSDTKYAERRTATGELMLPTVEAPHVSLKILIKKLDQNTEAICTVANKHR